ncbi:MAG: D-TA family PLP-dependent enzyme [Rhizobiaceae bacterium]|nr:D-TA family PLP-dependent enzyme [Rhizobiaceae bacterium]
MDDIETPAVIIDESIADRNISAFQKYCSKNGLNLRPHIKTHKLPYFAEKQLAAGAQGITCQKIGEAEVMANAGIGDILITFNIVGAAKLERLRALSDRIERLAVTADNQHTIEGLASAFANSQRPLNILIECDTGAGRCGVQSPEEVVELAKLVSHSPGLSFDGLMTYPPVAGAAAVNDFMNRSVSALKSERIKCNIISSGGSPDMWLAHEQPEATEYRIGTYIYNDRSLVERGVCKFADCALTVLATVVSTPTPTRSIIDAGSKMLTSDLLDLDGYGHVLEHPGIRIASLSEEHGILHHDVDTSLSVGDRISIVPNHVCVVSNMVDTVWIKGRTRELTGLAVAARGLVT